MSDRIRQLLPSLLLGFCACSGEPSYVTFDGIDYVSIDVGRAIAADALGSFSSEKELIAQHGSHSTAVFWSPRTSPAALATEFPVTEFGMSVPYGDEREDGSRLARFQGHVLSYYRLTDEIALDRNGTSYVPVNWKIESAGSYRDGLRESEWVFWHTNGTQRARGAFDRGVMTGTWEAWSPNGTVDAKVSGKYVDGVRQS